MVRERKPPKPHEASGGKMNWERRAEYREKQFAAGQSGQGTLRDDDKRARARLRARKARLLRRVSAAAEGTATHAKLSQALEKVRSVVPRVQIVCCHIQ